jgi:uncharacterized CHY-type Zn-finger protein
MTDTAQPLPESFECPRCQSAITDHSTVMSRGGPIRKGHILVCGHCAAMLQLGDSVFTQMTPEQFARLAPETKKALVVTTVAVIKHNQDQRQKN